MIKKNNELNVPDNVKFLTSEKGQKFVDEIVKKNRDEEVIDSETFFADDTTPIETNTPCANQMSTFIKGMDHFTNNPKITDDELDKFAKKVAENWEAMKRDAYEKHKDSQNCVCPKSFDDFCKYIMDLHHRKNTDYGNAFHELYKKFGALNYVYPRLYEKLSRVESLLRNKMNTKASDCGSLVADEKISDTLLDIATYCIMTVEEMQYD